ncbi:MAG TPA: GNAT family N-acetyltransferase [Thermoleophilaceae bacterium]|nr:GNAT family N-acetyltransferase [Thermoleophilaceae bacterium]
MRPIRAGDKDALSDALAHLSPASVHARFLGPKSRFSASELRYLTEVDGHDHVALVAELAGQPGQIAGVGRWVRLPEAPESAEFAIVVGDPLQGKGLGSILADDLVAIAKAHGIKRFTATALSENAAIVRIMARLSDHLERHHSGLGVSELSVDLAA